MPPASLLTESRAKKTERTNRQCAIIGEPAPGLIQAVCLKYAAKPVSLPESLFPLGDDWQTTLSESQYSAFLQSEVLLLNLNDTAAGAPETVLDFAFDLLRPGGRLVVCFDSGRKKLEMRRLLFFAGFHRINSERLGRPRKSSLLVADKPGLHHRTGPDFENPKPLNILHLAGTTWHAYWVVEQLRELRARGHRVAAGISGPGSLSNNLAKENIHHSFLPLDFAWSVYGFRSFITDIYALAAHLRRVRPDVVQYHIFQSSVAGRLASWLADVPVRITMSPSPYYMAAPGSRLVEQCTGWMDTAILGTSKRIFELYRKGGIPEAKLHLIRYGDDPLKFNPDVIDRENVRKNLSAELGLAEDCPLIVRVSYFYPPLLEGKFTPPDMAGRTIKDHETLIEATPRILARYPEAKVLLLGSGAGEDGEKYLESLKNKVREMGLENSILFLGFRTNAQEILGAADVAVSCSFNHENDGGSKEALLMETPLVATDIGGVPEYVHQEKTGLLVPPGSPSHLADAIIRTISNPGKSRAMARRGRKFILGHFTLACTVDALDCLYRDQYEEKARRLMSAGYRPPVMLVRRFLLPFILAGLARRLYADELPGLFGSFKQGIANKIWCSLINSVNRIRILIHGVSSDPVRSCGPYPYEIRHVSPGEVLKHFRRNCYLVPKRLFDITLSAVLLAGFYPFYLLLAIAARAEPLNITVFSSSGQAIKLSVGSLPGYINKELNPATQAGASAQSAIKLLWWVPALTSVLRGKLSFIGPRLTLLDQPARGRPFHPVPGLTGWSQLNYGATDIDLDLLDDLYCATSGPILDLKILVKSVLQATGIV